ncbi:MAG TPA: malto-oligosyltrehalose synthase [Blastocatellia bacterium]|nr:malto-oligosyltrehalose synthase [Blastocatellia bacterium]
MYIPSATYRLQFSASFGFEAASRIVSYLADLGADTVYASPIFKSRKDSTHGYDVVDPNEINPQIGSRSRFQELVELLRRHRMGWLQDFVPNHMAYDSRNRMLMDIFEKGPSSPFYDFFDVVWDHLRENLRGKLIAPFLGSPYGETLEKGEISLEYSEGEFSIKYYNTVYPIRIESYAAILNHRFDELKERLGHRHPDFVKAVGTIYIIENLPREPEAAEARNAQIIIAKELLQDLYDGNDAFREFVDENVREFNRDTDLLDDLLFDQWFRLSFWKVATKEINYQRFFNINELISLRMEDEKVFRHIHRLVFDLLGEGLIDGLRIDHVDGVYDPSRYLARLREAVPDAYIVVEKILEFDEQIPGVWPVQGTTGYEFMNHVNGLFVDASSRERFDRIYAEFSGVSSFEDMVYEKKKLLIERHLTGDLDNLTYVLKKISTTSRQGIDLAWIGLKTALMELAALFPVYRTYTDGREVSAQDRMYIEEAIKKAQDRSPELARELDFIEKVLWLDYPESISEEDRELWLQFVMRFQQFTSPLMAKGLEDTTLYLFNRLLSLNEVGGSPDRFGTSIDEFHRFNLRRQRRHPHALSATSTHDTKRGEDARARINVLSEVPEEWEAHVRQWHEENLVHKRSVGGELAPDRNEEYLLYQTLIGAFPYAARDHDDFIERIKGYMIKAIREAKTHSFWLEPNLEYEAAVLDFVEAILTPSPDNHFLINFIRFEKKTAYYGTFNSLAQALLKITAPGVPDLYQGSEIWDLSLVDPDNRRPVDFEKRESLLREIKEKESGGALPLIEELLSSREDGRLKMFTVYRALNARKERRDIFDGGEYIPLKAGGQREDRVVAFARRKGDRWAIAVAPRLLATFVRIDSMPLGKTVWGDTIVELPEDAPARWRHVFTDQIIEAEEALSVAEVFRHFPAGFLIGETARLHEAGL